ncbi:MAG: GNAT family N-acetyltransferase [Chloroflexi bacterium]|nr:GNAT family N-acetyltransferase [Chloroflexota bacterium]
MALGPQPKASMVMVEADLRLSADNGGIFCGIYDPGGVMLGVVDVIPSGYEGEAQVAFLELLMIAQPYRSVGLGRDVVNAVEADLIRVHKIHTVRAGVQVNNPRAIQFWQRMGYAVVSGPQLYNDGTTAYQLRKEITG